MRLGPDPVSKGREQIHGRKTSAGRKNKVMDRGDIIKEKVRWRPLNRPRG